MFSKVLKCINKIIFRWQLTQTKKMLNHQGPKKERGNVPDRESGTVSPHQHVNATVLENEIVLSLLKGNVANHPFY